MGIFCLGACEVARKACGLAWILQPGLELFEVWEIMVLQIIIAIVANVINFKQL